MEGMILAPRSDGHKRFEGLEIEEDPTAQRRIWRFERVGWAGLTLVVGAGLLGLFGDGPLSRSEIDGSAGALTVRYERFIHNDTQTTLELRATAVRSDGPRWISVSADYASRVRIERVMPEPERTVVTDKAVRFGFDPEQAGERGVVTIVLTPLRAGVLRAEIGVADGPPVSFTQLVYP